jgi:hypothetical protein
METLTINISLSDTKPNSVNDNCDIIDLNRTMNDCNNQIVNNLYLDESTLHGGLSLYDELINQLHSNEKLSTFKIFNFSLLNFSITAQKLLPSWEVSFCTFLFLFQKKGKFLNQKYKFFNIILPEDLNGNMKQIKSYLQKNRVDKKINFIHTSTKKLFAIRLRYFISKIVLLKKLSFLKPNHQKIKESESMNIFFAGESGENLNEIYNNLKNIFISNNKTICSLFNVLNWSSSYEKINHTFFKNRPSLHKAIGIYFSLLHQKRKLNYLKNIKLKLNNHEFDGFFIKNKMDEAFTHPYTFKLLIDLLWLRIFFSSISKKTNFFFKDEFYTTGKIISAASKINVSNITTYGIQHNSIDRMHFTYRLALAEIENNNHFPDYFLVWSDKYKSMLDGNNISRASKIITTGSPIHDLVARKVIIKNKSMDKLNNNNNNKFTILWALSNKSQFNIEIDIISKCLNLDNTHFLIRNHPNEHIKLNDVNHILKNINHTISKDRSLEQDLIESDLIICGYFSTIVFDAAMLNKNAIMMCDVGFRNASISNFNNHYCSSSNELEMYIKKQKNNLLKDSNKKSIRYESGNNVKCFGWETFISELI